MFVIVFLGQVKLEMGSNTIKDRNMEWSKGECALCQGARNVLVYISLLALRSAKVLELLAPKPGPHSANNASS